MIPPKIAIWSAADGWGGDSKFWYEAAFHPAFARVRCDVLLPESEATRQRQSRLAEVGVRAFLYKRASKSLAARLTYKTLYRWNPETANRRSMSYFRRIEREPPALVWFNLGGIGEVGWLDYPVALCNKLRIPYWLVIQHVPEQFFFIDDKMERRGAAVLESAARVVFISRKNQRVVERAIASSLQNAWQGRNAITHEQILLGGETGRLQPVQTTGPIRLLNLARMEPEFKGQNILMEVLADPIWKDRDWFVTFQGGGPKAEYLGRLVKYYGLPPERIAISSRTEAIFDVIGQHDLLVMPSLSEGTPYALVESMAAARPAVATAVGGIPELIREGETGWLAESSEPLHVAAALERACIDRNRWPDIGSAGQRFVAENYDLDHSLPQLIDHLLSDIGAVQ